MFALVSRQYVETKTLTAARVMSCLSSTLIESRNNLKQNRARFVTGRGAPQTQLVPLALINRQATQQELAKALPITRIVQTKGNHFFVWCSCQWQEEHTSKSSAYRSKRAHLRITHFHTEYQFTTTKKGKS